jgi:hypothetical protein
MLAAGAALPSQIVPHACFHVRHPSKAYTKVLTVKLLINFKQKVLEKISFIDHRFKSKALIMKDILLLFVILMTGKFQLHHCLAGSLLLFQSTSHTTPFIVAPLLINFHSLSRCSPHLQHTTQINYRCRY